MIIDLLIFPNNHIEPHEDNKHIDYNLTGDSHGFSRKVIAILEGIERDYDIIDGHLQRKEKNEEDN